MQRYPTATYTAYTLLAGRDFARINEDATSARWNALMAELRARAPEATPDEWWAPMELVFDMDWPHHR